MAQRIRGLVVGGVVGIALGAFVYVGLHAIPVAAAIIGGIVGLSVMAVVATATGPEDAAADAAWRAAAPDLPPVSDRVALERLGSSSIPHGTPSKPARRLPRPRGGMAGVFGRTTRSAIAAPDGTIDEAAAGPGGAPASADLPSGRGMERS